VKKKRIELFLHGGRSGPGRVFTIHPSLIVLFFLLLVGSGVGIWAVATGEFSLHQWKFRLRNSVQQQQTIERQLQEIATKEHTTKEQLSALVESLSVSLITEKDTVDSAALSQLSKLSIKELEARTHKDAHFVDSLLSVLIEDSSYWYDLPLGLPVPTESMWFLKNGYGMMPDPMSGKIKMHRGIDFSAQPGVPVVATGHGRVVKIVNDRFLGTTITIAHRFGYSSVYAHLGSVAVKRGSVVNRGDTVGTVGESGWTTSPLVHYEILKEGENFDPSIILWYLHRS